MTPAVLVFILLLPALSAGVLSREGSFENGPGSWHRLAAREEIAPEVRVDGRHSRSEPGALMVHGGGNPAASGGWERSVPGVQPGKWYKLTAWYLPEGLTSESNQVVCRLGWLRFDGRKTGQPDFAWEVTREGDWRRLTITAPAPAGAAAAQIQLLLQNAPRSTVWWDDIQLEETDQPSPRLVRISAVRLRPSKSAGADENRELFAATVQKDGQPADLVILPEGMTVVGTGKSYAGVAETIPGPSTERLGKLAKELNAWVVAGIYERSGPAIYNTAVLLDRQGRFAGKYRKVYLPREEIDAGLTPGNEYPVFQTDFGKLGLMICWDVQYPDPARALALRGAEIVALPIWGGNLMLTRARAIENNVFLATSGYDIPSLILDPKGETLASTEQNGTVAHAVVDLNRRYEWEWLGSMRGRFHRETRLDVPMPPR